MPREAVVGVCVVEGCTRRWRTPGSGLCRMHADRQRKGKPLVGPRDPRQQRKEALHAGRSHRTALRELARRLQALDVVEDQEQAEQLVAVLVVAWPTNPVFDYDVPEFIEYGGPDLFGL